MELELIQSKIRDISDFPKPGILFKDITPLLQDPSAFAKTIDAMAEVIAGKEIDVIAGVESRGFFFGPALAYKMGKPFVPVRKAGKLPWKRQQMPYSLEYGEAVIEIHDDAFVRGHRVLLIDDVLATGGTASAACKLVEKLGATVAALVFLGEIEVLSGRKKLSGYDTFCLLKF